MLAAQPYDRLKVAIHIYLACQYECYMNYQQLGIAVFEWMLSEEDLARLRLVTTEQESKFPSVLGYETQQIAQKLQLPAVLVHNAFLEVIRDEYDRENGKAG